MKKSISLLGFCFVASIAFAQQNNDANKGLLYPEEKNIQITIDKSDFQAVASDDNTLVFNEMDVDNVVLENSHEYMHDAFRFDGDSFDYREGVYTLNEYVFNYEYEFLTSLNQ